MEIHGFTYGNVHMEKMMLCELRGEFLMWMKAETGKHLLYPSRPHGEDRHGEGLVQVTTIS